MCGCSKPNVNGTPGAYSWDGKSSMTWTPVPPTLKDGDELIYDLPGRCGGIDSHSHHLTLVKQQYGGHALLTRHGGGEERLPLGYRAKVFIEPLAAMDDNARYWFLLELRSVAASAVRAAQEATTAHWQQAAAEKRIKTRKQPNRASVKVWIEPKKVTA